MVRAPGDNFWSRSMIYHMTTITWRVKICDFENKNTRTKIKNGISDEFEVLVGCGFITLDRGVHLDRCILIWQICWTIIIVHNVWHLQDSQVWQLDMAEISIPCDTTTVSELLHAFWFHYRQLEARVREAVTTSADTVVLWRLSNDHDVYIGLINELQTYACYIYKHILMIPEV